MASPTSPAPVWLEHAWDERTYQWAKKALGATARRPAQSAVKTSGVSFVNAWDYGLNEPASNSQVGVSPGRMSDVFATRLLLNAFGARQDTEVAAKGILADESALARLIGQAIKHEWGDYLVFSHLPVPASIVRRVVRDIQESSSTAGELAYYFSYLLLNPHLTEEAKTALPDDVFTKGGISVLAESRRLQSRNRMGRNEVLPYSLGSCGTHFADVYAPGFDIEAYRGVRFNRLVAGLHCTNLPSPPIWNLLKWANQLEGAAKRDRLDTRYSAIFRTITPFLGYCFAQVDEMFGEAEVPDEWILEVFTPTSEEFADRTRDFYVTLADRFRDLRLREDVTHD